MRREKGGLLAAVLAAGLAGCCDDGFLNYTYQRDLAYTDLASGSGPLLLSNNGARNLKVFQQQAEYEAEFAIYSAAAVPAVDFLTHQVAVLETGPTPAGYLSSILAVEEHSDSIRVKVHNIVPGVGCIYPGLVYDPSYHFIAVPRGNAGKPLIFVESAAADVCP